MPGMLRPRHAGLTRFRRADEVGAIVLDIGSLTSKVGFAGEDAPKGVFPTAMGVVADAGTMDTGASAGKTYHAGTNSVFHARAGMEVANPLSDSLGAWRARAGRRGWGWGWWVDLGSEVKGQGSRVESRGSRVKVRGSRVKGRGSRV